MSVVKKGDLVAISDGNGPYVALSDSYVKLVRTPEDWEAMAQGGGGDYGTAHLFVRLAFPNSPGDVYDVNLDTRSWSILERAK